MQEWEAGLLAMTLAIVVMSGLVAVLAVVVGYGCIRLLRQNAEYADRQMATDWPSYVGYVQRQPGLIPPSTVRMPLPTETALFAEDPPDPDEGKTVARF